MMDSHGGNKSKVPPSRVKGAGSVGLGDAFYTPLEMLPNTLGRYLNTPTGGICVIDARHW